MAKQRTIKLSYPWINTNVLPGSPNVNEYRVEQITNSIEFQPHDRLEKKAVDVLCHSPKWNVTIVPSSK